MATIVFGGSFNPVHLGHYAMAQSALELLPNATLIWMPAACSPFKTNQTLAEDQHRFAMCQYMAKRDSRMVVSDLEFSLEKPSYTVNTLKRLQQEKKDEYYFLCGADSFLSLFKWKDIETLLSITTFLVANREGAALEQLNQQKEKIESLGGRVLFLSMKDFPISSTEVREKLKQGVNCLECIDSNVLWYIQENNLYRE